MGDVPREVNRTYIVGVQDIQYISRTYSVLDGGRKIGLHMAPKEDKNAHNV